MEILKEVLYEGALTLCIVASCLCRTEGNLRLSSVENLVDAQSEISFTFYVSHPVHMQHICPIHVFVLYN